MNLHLKIRTIKMLLLMLCSTSVIAQSDSTTTDLSKKPKKNYNLSFRLDYSLNDLNFKNNLYYEGEYYENNTGEYTWKTFDSTLINYDDIYKHTNLKFDLMLSISKSLNIGLSYHLLNIQASIEKTDPFNGTHSSIEFFPFFALAGMVDYKFAIKPVKRLYLNPSVSLGTYQGLDLFTGVGREWYSDVKLAILYNIGKKERFGVRLYGDYNNWLYREKRSSRPFPDRNRIVKANLSSINFGFGLSYRFILIPD